MKQTMNIGSRRLINVYDGRGSDQWVAGTLECWDEPNLATFKLDDPHEGRTHHAIPLPNGRHRLKMVPNLLARAAQQDDADDAARMIQDALGIETGDVAGHMLPDPRDWQKLVPFQRLHEISSWLTAECMAAIEED